MQPADFQPKSDLLIPRVIHQTFGSKDIPEAFRKNIERLKADNPGWEYKFYTDDDCLDFVLAAYGRNMLDLYESIDPAYGAARADFFRYLLIQHSGGVYLDIKSSASRPLDEILLPDDTFILAQWDNQPGQDHEGWGHHAGVDGMPADGEFVQWFIAGVPRHPMIKAVVEHVSEVLQSYHPLRNGVGSRVVAVTGPVPYTHAVMRLLDQCTYRRLRDYTELGLRYSLVSGAMQHRQVSNRRHYTRIRTPIVNRSQSPIIRLAIRAVLEIKALRRRLLGLG